MNEFCKEKGFAGWFETSAKDNINVEQAAKFLVSKVKSSSIYFDYFIFQNLILTIKDFGE